MKNRKIILLIIFIIFTITLWYTYLKDNDSQNKINTDIKNKNIEIKKEENKNIEVKTNKTINDFKREIISKWLIIKWDIHLKNDDYLFALQKFSKANKETPNNPKVLSKIAETYFLMKNYKSAYKYFNKIENKENIDKNKMTLSFLYSKKIEDFDFERNSSWSLTNSWTIFIQDIKNEIKNIKLTKNNEFYYLNSLECLNSFHNCKLNFENYFKNTNYSPKNENLEKIRTAINNYKILKTDELYYKNTLIIWALFSNENFPIAILLSEDLLKEKTNYKSILKILAQSYFELNKLKKANHFLLEYAKIDSKSPDVYYMRWVISQKNHDYITSNIFLRLALEQEYKDVESIYRLQLYNYLILKEKEKILNTFDKIITSKKKPNFNDLLLATYYNIINGKTEKALILTNTWLKLYPEKEDFYWFKGWLKIEEWKLDEALKLLDKAKEINNRNALVILNLWRISKIKYEKDWKTFDKIKAKFLFKKASELDSAEIGELANKLLKELSEKENK